MRRAAPIEVSTRQEVRPVAEHASSTDDVPPPLAGFTIAVAADRRRHPAVDLFEAQGARTVSVHAVQTLATPNAEAIRTANLACLAGPINEVVVASVFGLRAWLAVARQYGQFEAIVRQLEQARLLARDARVADELRDLGLTQIWSTAGAETEDLFHYLLAQPMVGRRVLAQIDSESERELCHALRSAGAHVVEVATTNPRAPRTVGILRRLCDLVIRRQVDAVALTSAAVTSNMLAQATSDGVLGDLLNAFVGDVVPACLGPLAAEPLSVLGVTGLITPVPLMKELAVTVANELPSRALVLAISGRQVELRGQAVVVDGTVVPMQPGPIAVLRALASRPGRVLSSSDIRALAPNWTAVDDHAVEMAISRLRRSLVGTRLDGVDLVQTVVRRGYRLSV
jgi:uroporphyrinogen-III synthase